MSLVRCGTYEPGTVEAALRHSIDLIGGIEKYISPGWRVVLKVNLLTAAAPEKAITTHPSVVLALSNLVRGAGAHPVVADSPGPIPHTTAGLKMACRGAGLLELEEKGLLELNWDTGVVGLPCPSGKVIKRFEVMRPVAESDAVIAVPKLKTHMLTSLTGATKILFGVIPGYTKAGYHAKLQEGSQFAEMLLDIILAVKPALYVMDGIIALQGDGPGFHGQPRPLGLIMASDDAVAMDAVTCSLIGFDPMDIPMLRAAAGRGWWDGRMDSLNVKGESLKSLKVNDFVKPSRVTADPGSLDRMVWHKRMWGPLFKQGFTLRPLPNRRCTGCSTCVRVCPQKAVTLRQGRAWIDDERCIRCYCCHEMCPEAAIDLKYGLLGRTIRRLGMLGRETSV
ncbi:MAG: DUF362 domain-containing protein [Bacillota bacterium]